MKLGNGSLSGLPLLRDYRSLRSSSFDRDGGNRDWWGLEPGEARTVLQSNEPGCVRHLWMTAGGGGPHFLRGLAIRAWWDGQAHPSIECPLGDFFGIGFGMHKDFVSLPLQMSPQDGRGMNCWWPMPFDAARIEIVNDNPEPVNLYFYLDYEQHPSRQPDEVGRFCCQWRRESPTDGWCTERLTNENLWDVWGKNPNLDGSGNYTILDAAGDGIYVGCVLSVDCFQRQANYWYGEGDDMIFVDGEPWPPALHGTGTEDYFNMAFCPRTEYCAPYHGLTVYSGNPNWNWKGKNSMYRFHIEDPIRFRKSIRVSIEHGHANKLSNDYSSAAFWYQLLPSSPLPKLLPYEGRIARPDEPEFG